MVLSSFKYISNYIETRAIFGTTPVMDTQYTADQNVFKKIAMNELRLTSDLVNFDGIFGYANQVLNHKKAEIFGAITRKLSIDLESTDYLQPGFDVGEKFQYFKKSLLSEDTSWFGPLSFVCIPIAFFVSVFSKQKNRTAYAFFALFFFVAYALFIIVQRRGWDPYQGRYYILPMLVAAPLLAGLTSGGVVVRRSTSVLLGFISCILIFNALMFNLSKPFITERTLVTVEAKVIPAIPANGYPGQKLRSIVQNQVTRLYPYVAPRLNIIDSTYYEQLYYQDNSTVANAEFINKVIPPGTDITILIDRSVIEFSLFGVNKTRNVFPINDIAEYDGKTVLLVSNSKITEVPTSVQMIAQNETYSIYRPLK
jgi:hypothetical protein